MTAEDVFKFYRGYKFYCAGRCRTDADGNPIIRPAPPLISQKDRRFYYRIAQKLTDPQIHQLFIHEFFFNPDAHVSLMVTPDAFRRGLAFTGRAENGRVRIEHDLYELKKQWQASIQASHDCPIGFDAKTFSNDTTSHLNNTNNVSNNKRDDVRLVGKNSSGQTSTTTIEPEEFEESYARDATTSLASSKGDSIAFQPTSGLTSLLNEWLYGINAEGTQSMMPGCLQDVIARQLPIDLACLLLMHPQPDLELDWAAYWKAQPDLGLGARSWVDRLERLNVLLHKTRRLWKDNVPAGIAAEFWHSFNLSSLAPQLAPKAPSLF